MKVQLLSDLHIEFSAYDFQDVGADVVVLAGDIHTQDRGLKWAMDNIPDSPVIYVLGNHEFYGATYPKLICEMKALAKGSNVHILENDTLTIDGVNFIGSTLWTDFELFGDPVIAGISCQEVMADFKRIRRLPSYSKIRSIDIAGIHRKSKKWLTQELISKKGQINVVVTHHAPSLQSSAPQYKADIISAAFASDLEKYILQYRPAYWLHGHMHHASDYQIGDCRVLCNPLGYPGENAETFLPGFCFEPTTAKLHNAPQNL